jgi:hypothetical protein
MEIASPPSMLIVENLREPRNDMLPIGLGGCPELGHPAISLIGVTRLYFRESIA